MSRQNHPAQNDGFESRDMGAKAVYGFLMGLALLMVVVYFAVNGVYGFLNHYQQARQPAQAPLKQVQETDIRDTQVSRVAARIERTFPEPHLETDERNQITDFRVHEEEQLNSYDWVDQSAGVVRIPIGRAMQLTAERGLPVRSQAGAKPEVSAKANAAAKTKSAKHQVRAR